MRRIGTLVHLGLSNVRLVVSGSSAEHPAGIGHFAIGADELSVPTIKSKLNAVAISDIHTLNADQGSGEHPVQYENFFIRDPTSGVVIEVISPLTK